MAGARTGDAERERWLWGAVESAKSQGITLIVV